MVASLPVCAAIQSKYNEKYLSYVKEEGNNKAHNKHVVRFSGEEIVSRSTKFAIERSSKHKELIHLRCCHNNKYLVRKSEVEQLIVATAEKPEEDHSIWSSTLFEPVIVENSDGYGQTVLRLKHFQSRLYACMMLGETDDDDVDSFANCLYLGSCFEDPDSMDVVKIIDWGTLVILPKRVAFKSSTHGKYLVSSPSDQRDGSRSGYPCILSAADDKALASVIQEVVTNPNGTIGIKSCDTDDGLWTSNEIGEIEVEPLVSNEKTLDKWIFQKFSPVKVSSNVISLRCPSFNKFCNINGDSLQLECKANSILREAKFAVEEVVVSRDVYDIIFHLDDARIYDELTLVLATSTITNPTENAHHSQQVLKFQDKRSSTWTNGGSLSLGVKVNFRSKGVPFISENGSLVIVDKLFEGKLEWGESQIEIFEMEKTFSTSVPPKTESTVRVVCTRGTCDVPFSYTVREVHADGKTLVYQVDDGVYTAMNSYNSLIDIDNKPI